MSQIESGGLSTVMKLPGSSDPKNHAFQLTLADFTAAACTCSTAVGAEVPQAEHGAEQQHEREPDADETRIAQPGVGGAAS